MRPLDACRTSPAWASLVRLRTVFPTSAFVSASTVTGSFFKTSMILFANVQIEDEPSAPPPSFAFATPASLASSSQALRVRRPSLSTSCLRHSSAFVSSRIVTSRKRPLRAVSFWSSSRNFSNFPGSSTPPDCESSGRRTSARAVSLVILPGPAVSTFRERYRPPSFRDRPGVICQLSSSSRT